ncbi:MAG: alpha/beta hydrolase [Balneolaceae bacterium]|nr:alpha/beta hydrolase [Balneolaceae bacterium]
MAETLSYQYEKTDVHYKKVGAGPPLLILHGWGSSGRVMMPVAEQLSDIRMCYVLDLPGFGDTAEPPSAWNIDDYTDMIEEFIQSEFGEPVDLLVHSFGGRITLKLCARPAGKELVNKVLITGGAGMKPKRSLSFYIKKYTAIILKAPFVILPHAQKEKALAKLRDTKLWQSLGSSDYSKLSGVMRETFVKSVTEYLEPCLPEIPHEVLLLWGNDDQATPLYQGERMEKGIENAAMVTIENAGHYAFLDRPKHFASIARAFLKG